MLYVFHVDLGCMYTFKLDLSLESVLTLKNQITNQYNIAYDNQVLLVTGGDCCEDNSLVHDYNGAGTISNPIFLFDKQTIMQQEQYSIDQLISQSDQFIEINFNEIQDELDQTLNSEDTSLKTIQKRTELAKKLNQLTTDIMSNCETLIRDQHLMYQAWCAVIANLEDVLSVLKNNVKSFEEPLKLFLTKRNYYEEKLNCFNDDLEKLNQIKILPSLHEDYKLNNLKQTTKNEVQNLKHNSSIDLTEQSTIDLTDRQSIEEQSKTSEQFDTEETLLNLINQKDDRYSLERVSIYCITMLEQFNEQLLERINEEMNLTIKTIDDNKKIKKIENRLYNLDMLLKDVHRHVQDQNMLTFGFIQNQNSANQYNDTSVFADLSCSHKNQLELMLKYYKNALSIRKKFQNSKRELTFNLLERLKTIMICETDLNSLSWRVLLYSKSLTKLRRSLEVVDQINLAPKIYFQVFKEINRRNKFNYFFKLWSSFIVKMNSKLITDENKERDEFSKLISNHFLKSFLPKFNDYVPEFACELPNEYDDTIPSINETEFCEFIKSNSKFDQTIESEDNLLNGLVYRLKKNDLLNSLKSDNNLIDNDLSNKLSKDDSMMISENEKLNLINFINSLFPIKQKQSTEIEEIKQRLNDEYELKLNELKLEFNKKLEDELINLQTSNQLNDCLNNINNCNHDSNNQLINDKLIKQNNQLPIFLNYNRTSVFKNLLNELLTIKYSDYLNDNETQLTGRANPNFISFVSSILNILWPRNYLF